MHKFTYFMGFDVVEIVFCIDSPSLCLEYKIKCELILFRKVVYLTLGKALVLFQNILTLP